MVIPFAQDFENDLVFIDGFDKQHLWKMFFRSIILNEWFGFPAHQSRYNPIKNVWNQLLQRALPSLLNHTNTLDFLKVGLVEEWERLSRECTY
jgi:hypothetical protein